MGLGREPTEAWDRSEPVWVRCAVPKNRISSSLAWIHVQHGFLRHARSSLGVADWRGASAITGAARPVHKLRLRPRRSGRLPRMRNREPQGDPRGRVRRRLAVRVGIALVTGIVLSVVVAWGIALVVPSPSFTASTRPTDARDWERSVPASLGEPDQAVVAFHAGASHWQVFWGGPDDDRFSDDCVANISRLGFPFVALEHHKIGIGPDGSFDYGGPRLRGQLPMPPGRDWLMNFVAKITGNPGPYESFLPWLPLWDGLIVNTIIYAGLVLLTWLGLGRLRRRRRVRRGQCAECAYELAGLEVCPECGRGVAPPAEHQRG